MCRVEQFRDSIIKTLISLYQLVIQMILIKSLRKLQAYDDKPNLQIIKMSISKALI